MTFSSVSTEQVYKRLKYLNCKKATGYDRIPPLMAQLAAEFPTRPIVHLVNKCIESSCFPYMFKYAEVTPVYKKDDPMNKANYRLISVLPTLSKIFEGILVDQMSNAMAIIFSPHLSGFRKHHRSQNVTVHFIENCKSALDNNNMYGTVLTDLSKAFDCLPYQFVINKLCACDFNHDACMLIASYFTGRKQRVKLGGHKSEWLTISKGAPQGSIFGPFVFNLFQNDPLSQLKTSVMFTITQMITL